jgi:hypothetical protein
MFHVAHDLALAQSSTRPPAASSEAVQTILQLCLATGERQQIEGTLRADGRIRLTGPSLSARGDVTLSREEWTGLIGGISPEMTAIQAQQADRVRDCLAPAREAIMRRMLGQ